MTVYRPKQPRLALSGRCGWKALKKLPRRRDSKVAMFIPWLGANVSPRFRRVARRAVSTHLRHARAARGPSESRSRRFEKVFAKERPGKRPSLQRSDTLFADVPAIRQGQGALPREGMGGGRGQPGRRPASLGREASLARHAVRILGPQLPSKLA